MKNGGTALEPSARRSSVRGMKTEEKEDADKATLRSRRPTTRYEVTLRFIFLIMVQGTATALTRLGPTFGYLRTARGI